MRVTSHGESPTARLRVKSGSRDGRLSRQRRGLYSPSAALTPATRPAQALREARAAVDLRDTDFTAQMLLGVTGHLDDAIAHVQRATTLAGRLALLEQAR